MDMMDDNAFPPNKSLSPINNSYPPPPPTATVPTTATHMEPNSMMMFSQQMPTHIQHHQAPNQMPNIFYRQPSQA
ncbi:unnamed protein product, partial [Rotaria socialis]